MLSTRGGRFADLLEMLSIRQISSFQISIDDSIAIHNAMIMKSNIMMKIRILMLSKLQVIMLVVGSNKGTL